MNSARTVFAALFIMTLLVGCTNGGYQVAGLPQHNADLYPVAQQREDVVVAIDAIESGRRAQNYFGVDLIHYGIYPVVLIVSNQGSEVIEIGPADVVLSEGDAPVDLVPVQRLLELIASSEQRPHYDVAKPVEETFNELAFSENTVRPGETYRGVLFYRVDPQELDDWDAYFETVSIFQARPLRLRVAVTDLQNDERAHFGPFALQTPVITDDESSYKRSRFL